MAGGDYVSFIRQLFFAGVWIGLSTGIGLPCPPLIVAFAFFTGGVYQMGEDQARSWMVA